MSNSCIEIRLKVYLPSATKLRQGKVFTPVCHSVHRGGSVTHPPSADTLSQAYTPRADTPWADTPPTHSTCWDTVNKRAVRILLECNLVTWRFLTGFVIWRRFNHFFLRPDKERCSGHKFQCMFPSWEMATKHNGLFIQIYIMKSYKCIAYSDNFEQFSSVFNSTGLYWNLFVHFSWSHVH